MEKDVEKCVMAAVVGEGWIPRPPVWLNRLIPLGRRCAGDAGYKLRRPPKV